MDKRNTKYVPLCMRHDLPPPTRKIPRLQPLVAVPPPFQMTCKTSQTRSLRSAEVVNVPIRLVGPAKSVNQEPHTIPRPKVIPPLPPLTVYMNRVFTPPPLSPKKAPGLRRYRSKSSTILREPSFSCIPELEELECKENNKEKVYFTLHSPTSDK